MRARTTSAWDERFRRLGVPSGPVKTVAEALTDPQCHARGLVVEADHPRYGTVRTIASPVRVGERRARPVRAPRLGEHTVEVVSEVLQLDPAEVRSSREAGAFGPVTGDVIP